VRGGLRPFNGDADATVTNKLGSDPPSILLVAPDVPPALVAIVGRLLSRNPDRRPRSARAVIRALDQALSAPRVAMMGEDTARFRAKSSPDMAALTRSDAEAYAALQIEMPTRASRIRRTAVQLLACGLTLSGVLAWVDMHGTSVCAEPALVAVADPAGVAARIVIDIGAVDVVAVASPMSYPETAASYPETASSYQVPSFTTTFGEVHVPASLTLTVERSIGNPLASPTAQATPMSRPRSAVEPAKQARRGRRGR